MVNALFALQLSLAANSGIVYVLPGTSQTGDTVGQVTVGFVLSTFLVIAGDSQPEEAAVPAAIVPQAVEVTYLTFILYPVQLSAVGGVLAPQVAPSLKLYCTSKPETAAGGVTIIGPQPELTTGDGAVGNITTLTVLDTQAGLTVPTALVPQAVAKTYLACME